MVPSEDASEDAAITHRPIAGFLVETGREDGGNPAFSNLDLN